jgi:hypothetical protein
MSIRRLPLSPLILAILFAAPSAHAGSVLTTSMVRLGSSSLICCDVVNAGSKSVSLIRSVRDENGDPLIAMPVSVTLAPGKGDGGCIGSLDATAYCRFEVTNGPSKGLRASVCVTDASGGCRAIETAH